MKNLKKIKFYNFADLHAKHMKDPEFRKAYEDLQPEFEIIKTIIKARAKQGLTQRQLAERASMTQSSLARFESGRSNPTWSSMKRLASALGLRIAIL